MTLVKTVTAYASNAIEKEDAKYRRIKTSGKAFTERVKSVGDEGEKCLRAFGFEKKKDDDDDEKRCTKSHPSSSTSLTKTISLVNANEEGDQNAQSVDRMTTTTMTMVTRERDDAARVLDLEHTRIVVFHTLNKEVVSRRRLRRRRGDTNITQDYAC